MAGEKAAEKRSAGDMAFTGLLVITAISCVVTLQVIFLKAPVEQSMGIVQKIFYFHVPAAYAMYIGATVCFVASAGYLARGTMGWDCVARAGADVAVVMGLMVLISGPLWAAKAWGVYWTWDPRLTTSLLSVLIYVSYVILRTFTGNGEADRTVASILGVMGAANLPIIHVAVRKWGGVHPEVIQGRGKGLQHFDMILALGLGFLTFTLLAILLVWQRARLHLAASHIDALEQDALELGLAGE